LPFEPFKPPLTVLEKAHTPCIEFFKAFKYVIQVDLGPVLIIDVITFLDSLAEPEIEIIFTRDKTLEGAGSKFAAPAFAHISFVYQKDFLGTMLFGLDGRKTSRRTPTNYQNIRTNFLHPIAPGCIMSQQIKLRRPSKCKLKMPGFAFRFSINQGQRTVPIFQETVPKCK
jgi:hypothetical protein